MATAENWLDVLIGLRRFYAAGIELVKRSGINFGSGISAVDNPTTQMTDVTVDLSHVTMAGDVSGTAAAAVVGKIRGVTVSPDAPTEGQFPYYDSETSTLKYLDPPVIYGGTPAQAAARAAFYGELWGDVRLAPLANGGDDAARFAAAAGVCSDYGYTLIFQPSTSPFEWRTVVETPSDLHATGYGAVIRSYLAESGLGQTNCVFVQKMGAVTLTTHLTADAVIGSDSITLYDAVQPGDILHLAHEPSTFRAMNVEVVSCTGSAHSYTVVIDRPVTMQFVTNDPVTVHASRPRNITIEGLEISGTGDRYGELEGGVNCHFKNIRTTTTGGNCIGPQLAHDVGNERCSITGCILDCGDYSQCGGAIETGDNSWMENDTVKRATVCGYWFIDSVACRGNAIHAYDCATAWSISGETTTEGGCFDCVLENSIASKITYYGVLIDAGTTRQTVRHVRVDKAADGVILLHSASDTLLDDVYCNGCDVSFFIGTSSGTVGRKWVSKASATDGVRIQGDVSISGLEIEHTAGHGVFLTSGVSKVKIDDFKITSTGTLNTITCDASTPEVYMSRGYLNVGSGAGSAGFIPQGGGGKYYLRDMQIVAGSGTTAIYAYTSGISIIDRGGLEITGAGTALTLASGSYANWGTFVNNGASDVTTTNALAALGKVHVVGLHTVGGTVATLPFVKAITAGTSFVTAGVAGDTSTYSYKIEV